VLCVLIWNPSSPASATLSIISPFCCFVFAIYSLYWGSAGSLFAFPEQKPQPSYILPSIHCPPTPRSTVSSNFPRPFGCVLGQKKPETGNFPLLYIPLIFPRPFFPLFQFLSNLRVLLLVPWITSTRPPPALKKGIPPLISFPPFPTPPQCPAPFFTSPNRV